MATVRDRTRTICIIACEISGDQNAARLARAIRRQAPDVRLIGAGGPAMVDAGVEVAVRTTDFSFVGFFDSLRMLRALLRMFRRCQAMVRDATPDVVVLVDSEIVTIPFAVWLRWRRLPAVFFFPPQVWFWGRWRLPAIRRLARRFITAFRPEADLYAAAGADTVWAGHPLRDSVRVSEDATAALRAAGLDPARPIVALMPGSRPGEIRSLCPLMLAAARILQTRNAELQFALPIADDALTRDVERYVGAARVHDVAVYRPASYAVLSRARVALQCPGTATLEAGLLGIPAVVFYRCRAFEYFFARLFLHIKFVGLPNILLGEMIQPELFHRNADAAHLADEAWSLLTDDARRRRIRSRLSELSELLGPPGAAERAALALIEVMPAPELAETRLAAEA